MQDNLYANKDLSTDKNQIKGTRIIIKNTDAYLETR